MTRKFAPSARLARSHAPRPWLGLVAMLAACTALAPGSVLAEIGKGPSGPGPSGCSVITVGTSSDVGKVQVGAGATVTCYYPNGAVFQGPTPPPPAGPPPCPNEVWVPWVWSEHSVYHGYPYGNGGVSKDPSGMEWGWHNRNAVTPAIEPGTHDWYGVYRQRTTGTGAACQNIPGQWIFTSHVYQPHLITEATSPPPWGEIQVWTGQLKSSLTAPLGNIGALPSVDRGLVGLPQCFWIDGVPRQRNEQVTLAGQNDGSGRSIYYVLSMEARLDSVTWDFGDGSTVPDATPPSACGTHDVLAAHYYRKISGPGQRYQVHAYERWTVSARLYWFDSGGAKGPRPIDVGPPLPPATLGPVGVYIGQIEGVPLS